VKFARCRGARQDAAVFGNVVRHFLLIGGAASSHDLVPGRLCDKREQRLFAILNERVERIAEELGIDSMPLEVVVHHRRRDRRVVFLNLSPISLQGSRQREQCGSTRKTFGSMHHTSLRKDMMDIDFLVEKDCLVEGLAVRKSFAPFGCRRIRPLSGHW
jgi:hypothetical protein